MTTSEYYFAGRLIKNNTGYVASDRLGSIGKFYPWGQEKPSATTNGTEKFTGYYRDSETGNDYAVNRYHQPGMGRFLTADPSRRSMVPGNPGSWNRYAYVLGDPVNGRDPSGKIFACTDGDAQSIYDVSCSGIPDDSGGGGDDDDANDGPGNVCSSDTLGALAGAVEECVDPAPPSPAEEAPPIPTSIALVPGSDCYVTTYAQLPGGTVISAQRDDSLEVLDQYGDVITNEQIQEALTPIGNSPCPSGTAAQNAQCLGEAVTGQFNDTHISLNGTTQAYYQGFNVTLNGISYNNLSVDVYNTSFSTTVITIYQNPYAVWLNGNNGYTNGQLTLPTCPQ